MKKRILLGLLFCSAILLYSCGSSTKVVSAWQAPNASSTNLGKMLVMAMMNDREAKDYIERQLVSDLSAQGVAAVSGTGAFGPRGFGNLTQEQIHQQLIRDGYSSVMIVCLTDKDKEVDYVPGSSYVSPYGPVYRGYYGRYMYMYDRVYTPGYFTSSTTYVLDADIYSLPGDQLIYSAQTRSYDPSSSSQLAKEFSEQIVNDLRNKGIF